VAWQVGTEAAAAAVAAAANNLAIKLMEG